jgi:hypothetical protein
MNMQDILKNKVDNEGEEITVSYEKKINVKQYETETLSASTSLKLNRKVSGMERVYIETLLSAQLEYSIFVQAGYRGYVTQTELSNRIKEIETSMTAIVAKAESVGIDLKEFMLEA